MNKKYLVAGHGLAGCVLALTFLRKKIPFKIAGRSMEGEASIASSGLITPITGRKYVKSWMIDEFIDSALDFYCWSEELLGKKYFHPVDIVRFLSHPEALLAWEKRKGDPAYHDYISNKKYEELDRLGRPYGILTGGYRLDAKNWLMDVRQLLARQELLSDELISLEEEYSGYDAVIYATGAVGPSVSAGLIPNKGEALVVRLPEWPYPGIMKEDIFFVPVEGNNQFWVGSYYERWPKNANPSLEGKEQLIAAIEQVYKGSFRIDEHLAGIRPTIDDRRPLVGPYPGRPGKFIFNGMGTKGTSLAPYWAQHLVSHLVIDQPIHKLVNPARYK